MPNFNDVLSARASMLGNRPQRRPRGQYPTDLFNMPDSVGTPQAFGPGGQGPRDLGFQGNRRFRRMMGPRPGQRQQQQMMPQGQQAVGIGASGYAGDAPLTGTPMPGQGGNFDWLNAWQGQQQGNGGMWDWGNLSPDTGAWSWNQGWNQR